MGKPFTRPEALCLVVLIYASLLWRWLTTDWSERDQGWLWVIAVMAMVLTLAGMYTVDSVYCAFGGDCTIANADWANWLFGKK